MEIEFVGEYKSLKSFISESLESFSVIIGKNGCGKSQLIEVINKKWSGELGPRANIIFQPQFKNIQIEGFGVHNLEIFNNSVWKGKLDYYLNEFRSLGENSKLLCECLLRNNMWFPKLRIGITQSEIDMSISEFEKLLINSLSELEIGGFSSSQNDEVKIFDFNGSQIESGSKKKACEIAVFVANYQNKRLIDLKDTDFYISSIPEYLLDEPKLFGSQLELVFYSYAKRYDHNKRLYFDKKEYKRNNSSISALEFSEKYPAPWILINEILKKHNVHFQFKEINEMDFSPDVDVLFQLIKTTTEKEVELNHLSSGEKIIIGLIIKLFTNNYYVEKLQFPELIILDEPDAHLHPEMSKLLIDVLNNTFVKELGIKVIITTHSPSTVALSPENSLYELRNEPHTSLKKIEKDEALKLLTDFIPTLSIDYKNHKQVFGESPTDIKYYQTIFHKLDQERNYPFKLYFISNSYGKGHCEQVKKIVTELRSSGNRTSLGIVDWDLNNLSSQYVKVHGFEKRYSLENYLYDPIYLCVLLMNLKAHNIYRELGIEETINQYLIGEQPDAILQKIIDWFFDKYYEVYNTDKVKASIITEVEYLNGKKLTMPTWFLQFQGHDFEKRIKRVFLALDKKYTSEGQLQEELTMIIGKCYPFIPKDSELLIEEIIKEK